MMMLCFPQDVEYPHIDSIHWRHVWVLLGLAWASLEMQEVEGN